MWSDDDEEDEESAEGLHPPTASLQREHRVSATREAKRKAAAGGGGGAGGSAAVAVGRKGGGGKARRRGQSTIEIERERRKAGPCLTCCGLIFANAWLLSMVAAVLLPLLYDGFLANETDYWYPLRLCARAAYGER